jgi:hypothetical protein
MLEDYIRKFVKEEVKCARKKEKEEKAYFFRDNNTGEPWTDFEDECLRREINLAIDLIAANHRRSIGAIKSRIYQKGHLRAFRNE